jgi:hypothetical protein
MANIVITSLDSNIKIDFNDLASKYALESLIRRKADFSFSLLVGGGVVINIQDMLKMNVHYDVLSIVDSVNGVAPTSDLDLYNKLSEILTGLDIFTTLIDEASATLTYFGKARAGSDPADPVWSISSMDTTAQTELLWAEGNGSFDKIFDDRAGYSYS